MFGRIRQLKDGSWVAEDMHTNLAAHGATAGKAAESMYRLLRREWWSWRKVGIRANELSHVARRWRK